MDYGPMIVVLEHMLLILKIKNGYQNGSLKWISIFSEQEIGKRTGDMNLHHL